MKKKKITELQANSKEGGEQTWRAGGGCAGLYSPQRRAMQAGKAVKNGDHSPKEQQREAMEAEKAVKE